MPWLYKPCSKKDARFHARCRVFARAARHSKPFLTEVVHPGMKCFPQWCVCGGIGLESTRRWVHGRSGATKSQHPKNRAWHRRSQALLVGASGDGCAARCTSARRLAFPGFQRATRGLTHATPDRVFLDNVHWRTMPDVERDPGWPRCRTATSCWAAAGSVKSACWALAGRR